MTAKKKSVKKTSVRTVDFKIHRLDGTTETRKVTGGATLGIALEEIGQAYGLARLQAFVGGVPINPEEARDSKVGNLGKTIDVYSKPGGAQ